MHARILTIASCALALAACGIGGSTGDSSQNQGNADCAAMCANVARAGCNPDDERECLDTCNEAAAHAAASESEACQQAHAAWVGCMTHTDLRCSGFGVDGLPCRADRDHARNYCVHGFTPEEPCLENPAASHLCPATAPNAKICRGAPESGCVVGGTDSNDDLYCCP